MIAPLAAGPLNVNADDAAAAIAVGVHADRLLFLTDVEGFMLDGEVVDSLDVATAEELHAGGTLDPTILPSSAPRSPPRATASPPSSAAPRSSRS